MANKISGKAILDGLENGFSQIERPSGRFPQVSGLVVVANPAAPSGGRVKRLLVNGEALDHGRDYELATNDFMASGGDGYGMLAGKTHVSADSGTRLVALDVIDYIAARSGSTRRSRVGSYFASIARAASHEHARRCWDQRASSIRTRVELVTTSR